MFFQKLQLVWTRITFSRLTTIYFIFSFVHFVLQVAFQSRALVINASASNFLSSIVTQGNASVQAARAFTVYNGDDLRLCYSDKMSTEECQLIWSPGNHTDNTFAMVYNASSSSSIEATSVSTFSPSVSITFSSTTPPATSTVQEVTTVTATRTAVPTTTAILIAPSVIGGIESRGIEDLRVLSFVDTDGQVKVKLDGEGFGGDDAVLGRPCLWALNQPVGILQNTKREDMVFLAFHFWVLGMSIVALLNESIPHILASLATHVGSTGWAAFQIVHTAHFKGDFNRLITNGACANTTGSRILLTSYWSERAKAEIPSLALNILALLVSVILTWKLVQSFGWQTFKRVGASRHISRIYKFVLTLSIAIQLSVFFMAVTVGLWLDQLWNGSIGRLADLKRLYQIVFLITLVLLIPWLMTGWFAVRKELKIPMLIFLVLCVGYFAGWGAMFLSDAFRWTFVQWRFFSIMACISVLLTLVSFLLGLICRWNFDRGLPRYLNGEHTLSESDEFINAPPLVGQTTDIEKVSFPTEKAIPTYAAAFEQPSVMGPRFFNASSIPFDQQYSQSISTMSQISSNATLTNGSVPDRSKLPTQPPRLQRSNSNTSSSSRGSYRSGLPTSIRLARTGSQSSTTSSGSRSTEGGKKRWVIE
jgi:hypothetical protein